MRFARNCLEAFAGKTFLKNSDNAPVFSTGSFRNSALEMDDSPAMSKPVTDGNDFSVQIERARQGDQAALGELLDRFRPLLRTRARESLGPALRVRVDESDIVQMACLAASDAIGQFAGESEPEFVHWLLRILGHKILRVVERERGAAKRDIDREVHGSAPLRNAAIHYSTPSQKAIRGEQRELLIQAIDQLPDGQREAVRLKYLEQATLSETARRLNKTEDAISGLLQRAITTLNRILRSQDTGDP